MAKVTQYCVSLENKPGTLAKLAGALKRAKVNVEAISVVDNTDCAWVRMVASPTAAAKKALDKGKYDYCTQRVFAVSAPDKPGELEAIAAKLTKAGVNITYVYGTGAGDKSKLVIGVDNMDKAAKALG